MKAEAYREWEKLYTEEVGEIWENEKSELKNATMILFVLKREFKNVLCDIEKQHEEIKLKYKSLEEQKQLKDNILNLHDQTTVLNSPIRKPFEEDLLPKSEDNSVLVESSDDTICPSPKLNRQKHFRRKKPKLFRMNDVSSKLDFDLKNTSTFCDKNDAVSTPKLSSHRANDLIDCSVIDGTPNTNKTAKKGRSILNISKKKSKEKKSSKNNTLTQMFLNPENDELVTKENGMVSDISRSPNKSIALLEKAYNTLDDVTLVEDMDFKEPKEMVCKDPVVRGKNRMKLEGWDCQECRKFYDGLDLNTQDVKNLMNKCSKHRATRKPTDYTIPGYWTLAFTPTQKTVKPELEQSTSHDSTFFRF